MSQTEKEVGYALPKGNFKLIAIGFVLIIAGFACMICSPAQGTEFNKDIFSPLHVTVGPVLAVIGFFFEMFAILYIPKSKKNDVPDVAESNKIEEI